jgi:DNA-binding NtrC family response regulator
MPNEEAARILIIDDEPLICRNSAVILSEMAQTIDVALNGMDAMKLIEKDPYHVVITDLKMSRMGGMEVLSRIRQNYPDTLVIVITGYASVSSAVEVMKLGAYDYLPKPFTPDELRAVVAKALNDQKIKIQNKKLMVDNGRPAPPAHQLIGSSPQIKKVISMIQKVAGTEATVLIYGESGTGKELVARAVHANSARKDKVFFAVDCGTLSGNLLESELFGYRKGAFTNAHKDKDGIFELANHGTVFLDEISNISMDVQGKLLRFLDTREFMPLGDVKYHPVDIRLIFATNKDLKEMVAQGSFRQDFYYRIFVYPIYIPPLRERKSDILPIAYHFLKLYGQNMGKPITGFDDEAVTRLSAYEWPGNIRQLRNMMERAVILCDKDKISLKDLPHLGEINDIERLIEYVPETNDELKNIKKELRQKAADTIEKNFIIHALEKNAWNVTKAAQAVGLLRTNFQNLMKKHRIKPPAKDVRG